MAIWDTLAVVGGGLLGDMMNDPSEGKPSSSNTTSSETRTEYREPWGPSIPYVTGTGMLPSYLGKPIPDYNPEWIAWNEAAAKGRAIGPPPPMFLFDNPNEGYGGVPKGAPQQGAPQQGPPPQYAQPMYLDYKALQQVPGPYYKPQTMPSYQNPYAGTIDIGSSA